MTFKYELEDFRIKNPRPTKKEIAERSHNIEILGHKIIEQSSWLKVPVGFEYNTTTGTFFGRWFGRPGNLWLKYKKTSDGCRVKISCGFKTQTIKILRTTNTFSLVTDVSDVINASFGLRRILEEMLGQIYTSFD